MTRTRLRRCTARSLELITDVSITDSSSLNNNIWVLLVSGIPAEWYNKLSIRPLLDAFMNEIEVLSNNSAYKVSHIACQ